MRKVLEILTPENVYVEYELAGLGSRGIAYFIDSLIKWVLTIVVYIGLLLTIDLRSYSANGIPSSKYPLLAGIGFLVLFLINTGYFIIFEMIMKGQTPGKKAMKLRVIKENGEPINFFDSLLRNLLRILENTFTFNILGCLFIIFSPNYKRIGDYAAGTIVVKVRKEEKMLTAEALLKQLPLIDETEKLLNIYPVNNFEYGILKDFLNRYGNLGARRTVFEYHLNKYFIDKFGLEKSYASPKQFFEEIVRMNSEI